MRDGEPCGHKGCLSHISHPCEGCGRIAGKIICSIKFDYENCSAYEYGNDCGNCELTKNLTVKELRELLSTAQQRIRELNNYK